MSNVDKYQSEIQAAILAQAETLGRDIGPVLAYSLAGAAVHVLERALAEQREAIAEEIISRSTSVNSQWIVQADANIARNYGKEETP
jgi:hypothetical protein